MNKKIYRQADSRWGSLPYPTSSYSFAGNGCGCCAVLHCIIEQDKYKNYTPKDIRPYMVQYATKGNGTLWSGITKGLEHYGYNVHWRQSDTMTDIFNVLKNSLKRGVILFGSDRGPDGTCWTTGGHYIAFVNYKIENGKHYFYLKDSGGRKHDGWWQYEKSMRGDVRNVWICTSLKGSSKPTPSPSPTPSTKKNKAIDISAWQGNISTDNFKKVKSDGYDVVILRASYTGQSSFNMYPDSVFENNIKHAHAAGLKIGVYHYSQAITIAEAQKEAEYILKIIKPYKSYITEQVVFDWEFGGRLNASKAKSNGKAYNTQICQAFCKKVKAAGYEPMVYANLSTLQGYLNDDELKKDYKIWLAQYASSTSYKGYYLWQYSSSGRVAGLSGNIDVNKYASSSGSSSGSASNKLAVDGEFGPKSIKRAQKVFGTPVDGIISSQLTSVRKYAPGIAPGCFSYGNNGSALIRAIQKKVGAGVDGLLGPKTIKKLQKFLGITQDGIWGPATSKAFQKWLNAQK